MDGYEITDPNTGAKAWWDGVSVKPLPAASVMKQGQQAAMQDAAKTSRLLTREVLMPAAQASIALGTGGMSIPAQMAIGGATEMGAQASGLKPQSAMQGLLATAIPGAANAITRGVRGAASLLTR